MPFVAQCLFCRVMLQGVPDHCLGSSIECPRCHNSFTLAPMANPPPATARQPKAVSPEPAVVVAKPSPHVTAAVPAPAQPAPAVQVLGGAAPAAAAPPAPPLPAGRPVVTGGASLAAPDGTNYPGLASFLLGSFAFLAAAVLHVGWVTFALGLVGLLLGVVGCLLSSGGPRRLVLPIAGTAVSLPAVFVAAFLPHWLGLAPLWGRPKPPDYTKDAAISLSGGGGLRRATGREIVWVDASHDALVHGDVRLRVSSAAVETVKFVPVQGKQPPGARGLVIALRITNAGVERNINYTSWADSPRPQNKLTIGPIPEVPVLSDNQGKTYALKALPAGWVVKGHVASASIPAGSSKSLDDVLVFEAPPPNIEFLRLELPASGVGAAGRLHMEIPRQMIEFR
jgi:hypothetical protein